MFKLFKRFNRFAPFNRYAQFKRFGPLEPFERFERQEIFLERASWQRHAQPNCKYDVRAGCSKHSDTERDPPSLGIQHAQHEQDEEECADGVTEWVEQKSVSGQDDQQYDDLCEPA